MSKTGRNELCPCGSGLKYKRCCLKQTKDHNPSSPVEQMNISLLSNIDKIQRVAQRKEEAVYELGVFVLWSNQEGDAWLLEISDSDAVQVAKNGELLDPPIDENPETIEINWSHTFTIRDRQFFVTTYAEKTESCIETAPTKRINAAIRRIRKKFSEDVLSQVHINPSETEQSVS